MMRRPYSWAAWAALLMALLTTLVAWRAWVALDVNAPSYPVELVVQGDIGYGITQESVEARLAQDPVTARVPLTVVLTDRYLSGDETLRGQVPQNTVITSSQLDNLERVEAGRSPQERFNGTAFSRALAGSDEDFTDLRFELDAAFHANLSVGHGPAAAEQLVRGAAQLLPADGTRSPVFWLGAVGLCAMLTTVFLSIALRLRTSFSRRERRFNAAGRRLARVVLDLEALEASFATTPKAVRPSEFSRSWNRLQTGSLYAARLQEPLHTAIYARQSALSPATGAKLQEFEAKTLELTALADALFATGTALSFKADSTLDRLNRPIYDSATSLLLRLQNAPGELVAPTLAEQLREQLGILLDSANHPDSQQAIKTWVHAEHAVAATVRRICTGLRRFPQAGAPDAPQVPDEHLRLRENLGVKTAKNKTALFELFRANTMARAILGNTLDSDTLGQDASAVSASGIRALEHKKPTVRTVLAQRAQPVVLAVCLAVLLVASLIAAGVLTAHYTDRPTRSYDGSGQGMTLELDDPAGLISEEDIRRYMHADFTTDQHLIVAVRDAETYLEFVENEGSEYRDSTAQSVRSTMWRIKDEFKDRLVDGELPAGQAIIPLMITNEGKGIVPGIITGEVLTGFQRPDGGWIYGSIFESENPTIEVANAAEDYVQTLARNSYVEQDFGTATLFWILTGLIFFTVLNAVQALIFLLGATTRVSRLGRGATQLAKAKRRLEGLALGLDDSQLNAVAVLGARGSRSADETGQRLFERALAMAWREAEELEALPLSERLRADYAARAAQLERLAALLEQRDTDVAHRALELVRATRG